MLIDGLGGCSPMQVLPNVAHLKEVLVFDLQLYLVIIHIHEHGTGDIFTYKGAHGYYWLLLLESGTKVELADDTVILHTVVIGPRLPDALAVVLHQWHLHHLFLTKGLLFLQRDLNDALLVGSLRRFTNLTISNHRRFQIRIHLSHS